MEARRALEAGQASRQDGEPGKAVAHPLLPMEASPEKSPRDFPMVYLCTRVGSGLRAQRVEAHCYTFFVQW